MKRRRIAVLASFPMYALERFGGGSSIGANATWLPQIAAGLQSVDDLEIHWITLTKLVNTPMTVLQWGETFHLIPRWKHSVSILTGYFRERRRIHRLLDEIRPGLVHAWGTEDAYGLAAAERAEPKVLSMQGLLQVYCNACPQPSLLRWQAGFEGKTLRRIPHLTVESPWGRKRLRQTAPQARIDLLEYGVNPSFLNVGRKPDPSPLCIYVGTLCPLKGTNALLSAFSDDRLRGTRLVLVGDGPLRGVPGQYPENIEFAGRVPVADVVEWMRRSWCLVHPTLADTSPNCVKEARVIGVPVVTTPSGGQTQYVEHGMSGWIHEPGDVEGLIEGVLSVTSSMEVSMRLGGHGREACRRALEPVRTIDALCGLYRDNSAGCRRG